MAIGVPVHEDNESKALTSEEKRELRDFLRGNRGTNMAVAEYSAIKCASLYKNTYINEGFSEWMVKNEGIN